MARAGRPRGGGLNRARLLGGLAVAAACVAAGAYLNGQRWETKYQSLQLTHADEQIRRKDKNLATVLENQQAVVDAVQNFQYATTKNDAAYAELTSTVIGLRGTVSGLRGDFAGLPGFVRDASQEALGRYASTCTAVFERLAGEVASLGEAGARIAGQADKHAADALILAP